MSWQCSNCLAFNHGIIDEARSLTLPMRQVYVCQYCGERTSGPTTTTTPSSAPLLDIVEDALQFEKHPLPIHSASEDNVVEILDTPHIWGTNFDYPLYNKSASAKATDEFIDKMVDIISAGTQVIDIVTLNPPDKPFDVAIMKAIEAAVKATKGAVVIRILYGFVPVVGNVGSWRNSFAGYCRHLYSNLKVIPKIYVGQLYTKMGTWWNHAKIIASDGRVAIVGGHNLWYNSYALHPAVHDLSVRVTGLAAYDAQMFCEMLWNEGGYYLEAYQFDGRIFQEIKTHVSNIPNVLFSSFTAPSSISSSVVYNPIKRVANYDKSVKGQVGRILTLGRVAALSKPSNASDRAKEILIKSARRILKLCQQDLVFLGAAKEDKHDVCCWIAEALVRNGDLEVQIVVSPLHASAGGDQYSWGSGATGTYRMICKFLLKIMGEFDKLRHVIHRLQVAPFCFTKSNFTSEKDYAWSKLPTNMVFLEGELIPKPIHKEVPSPANHAKCYIADDSVYYVGSDNLYPNLNVEFGYLIEGKPVADLLTNYWNHVWKYSSPHCIKPEDVFTESGKFK